MQGIVLQRAHLLQDIFTNPWKILLYITFKLDVVISFVDTKVILLLDTCQAHYPHESYVISNNIFATYLSANVTSLIQSIDQGIIETMKCHYKRNFKRKILNFDGPVTLFQLKYTIKDAMYNITVTWKMVNKINLKSAWKKLWPSIMIVDGSSSEEGFEGFSIREINQLRVISAFSVVRQNNGN